MVFKMLSKWMEKNKQNVSTRYTPRRRVSRVFVGSLIARGLCWILCTTSFKTSSFYCNVIHTLKHATYTHFREFLHMYVFTQPPIKVDKEHFSLLI